MLFLFTKLDQMSRVGSRGRHPKCRPKTGKIGNSLSLASLARNLEICLVSRKTSKMQEIVHYIPR